MRTGAGAGLHWGMHMQETSAGEREPATAGGRRRGAPAEPSAARLRGCLESPFTEVRLHGMRLAGELGDPALARAVMLQLEDPQPSMRRAAARSLGRMQATVAVSALVERLEDPDPGVASDAAWALGVLGGLDPGAAWAPGGAPAPAPAGRRAGRRGDPAGDPVGAGIGVALGAVVGEAAGGAVREPAGEPAGETAGRRFPWRWDLLAVVGVLGFVLGRQAPALLGRTPVPPVPLGRDQARAMLFDGDDVLARLGRAASLARDGYPQGHMLLSRAVGELLFPVSGPTTARAPGTPGDGAAPGEGTGRPDLAEGSPGWPSSPPTREPTPVELGPATPAPVEPQPATPQVVQLPPVTRRPPPGLPRPAVAGPEAAELALYHAAARRYLRLGDRRRAAELVGRALGRPVGDEEVEGLLGPS